MDFKDEKVRVIPWSFAEGDVKAWEQQRFNLQHGGEILKFGASEVAQVCGEGFESAFNLFQIKLGRIKPKKPNILMVHGNQVESTIMEYARAYDVNSPDEETTAENFLTRRYKRKIEKAEYFLDHPDYPAILISLDGVLFKGEQEFDGNIAEWDIPVEFKNVTYSSFKNWEDKVPLYYWIQVQTQILGTGAPHGWFVALVDNRELFIRKVEANPEWFGFINDNTIDLSLRISKAKKIQEALQFETDVDTIQELETMLYSLEPEVTESEKDYKVLKEVYSELEGEDLLGDDSDLEEALNYLNYSEDEKFAKEKKDLAKNKLVNKMKNSKKMSVFTEDGQEITVTKGYRFNVKRKG